MKAGRKKGEIFFRLYQSTEAYNLTKKQTPAEVKTPEIRIFWLICGFLEDMDTLTVFDLIKCNEAINGYKEQGNRTAVSNLIKADLITTTKASKQYFAKSYITLTDKGNLLKAVIRDKINFNPHNELLKLLRQEAKKKKKTTQKAGKTRKATFKRLKQEGKPINQHTPKTK
jgi:DNA-binding transcriptional regulator PaaX